MHQHRGRRMSAGLTIGGVVIALSLAAHAQTPPDNTKVNARDRAKGAQTADQQKENPTDRALTQKIRRALMQDKTLSSYAHNVKVIAQSGHVTLKGPVRSEQEKQTVEAAATEAAGEGHVTSQISVVPAKTNNR